MAKGKYEEWLESDNLILLEGWARDGLIDEQIAKNIGIKRQTLYDWKKRYPDISDALKKGKEVVDFEVENALLKNAMSGDTVAQIFWLKNRKPSKWRDSRDRTDKQDRLLDAQIIKAEFDAELSKAKVEQIKESDNDSIDNIVIVDSWSDENE